MKLPRFELERYFDRYEFAVPYLLACSDCESFSVEELLALAPGAGKEFMDLRLGYTEAPGGRRLREAAASLYRTIPPERVLALNGAEEGIFAFMNAMLERGDHVVVQRPCYQSLRQIAVSIGCEVSDWVWREADGWAPDLEALKALLRPETRVVVVNSPHNPTGGVLTHDSMRELVRLSEEHDFILFSDEVYRFMEYDESQMPESACDLSETAVTLGVMSKTWGLPGLRIGWIATHNETVLSEVSGFKDYTTICNAAPSEFLATVALEHRDRLIERNRAIIRGNLDLLDDFFERRADRVTWQRPRGGPIAFPRLVGDDTDAEPFCRRAAEEAGVLLLPGSVFGDAYKAHFRIGFGRRNMPECLEQLDAFMDR